MTGCTCQGPWGIGLPFDHPIWTAIVRDCPVHGYLVPPPPPTPYRTWMTNTTEVTS